MGLTLKDAMVVAQNWVEHLQVARPRLAGLAIGHQLKGCQPGARVRTSRTRAHSQEQEHIYYSSCLSNVFLSNVFLLE